jgi:hypothetical protein
MASSVSFFNGNTYNTLLWNVSGVLSLGYHHLGHNPRLAHLIKHDPFCPCGLQGAIERNFRLFLAIIGAATLPLTYWKWKKLDHAVFGLSGLIFIGLMQWALQTANEHRINENVEGIFSDATIGMEVYQLPVVHIGALMLKGEGQQKNPKHYQIANCATTFERDEFHKFLAKAENPACPTCRLPEESIKLVTNYAAVALLNYAISIGKDVGIGHIAHHALGTDEVDGYYQFDQLAGDDVDPELGVIIAPEDGHTYPVKGYQDALGATDNQVALLPKNPWLAMLIKKIASSIK